MNTLNALNTTNPSSTGRKLLLTRQAADAASLAPQLVPDVLPDAPSGHAVVEVRAAAVNPSDVKAALGLMPHAVWPRTPGRDFAGTVVAGPAAWLGVPVWGTGGDLGVTRDGTHARYLVLPVQALSRKPESVPMAAAAAVGVPFITAHEGLRRAGLKGEGQTVLVFGANGKVGQAAIQLATRAGATVLGVERAASSYAGHASAPVRVFDGREEGLAARLLEATGGRGADIVFNTVGSPYFQAALDSLAVGGTQVLISTIERSVPFDILAFYRRNLQLLGVDTLKIPATQCARVLDELLPGFEDGSLRAFEVDEATLLPLEQSAQAYRRVLEGSMDRVVLAP
ncbi:quinone oxidoreductase family protein [Azohydromonas aeria]|uniref:quinone oxidoreductase family protein n=1 Tax=Azohydromonas aeria TaxID=2590212 RepID=UPI0012F75460|nr:zinc-binding dehydrogenase [Azohydromonas aeria]